MAMRKSETAAGIDTRSRDRGANARKRITESRVFLCMPDANYYIHATSYTISGVL